MLKIQCPNLNCGKSYDANESFLGRRVVCKVCGQKFIVTGNGAEPDEQVAEASKESAPVANYETKCRPVPQGPLPSRQVQVETPELPIRQSDLVAAKQRLVTQEAGVPEKIGRFEVQKRLGAGAFGQVYRARDPLLDREVALKVPHASAIQSEARRARVLTEAKAAAQLRHPNIVPVYEAGRDGDTYYIASAFIEGQTLEDAIAAERPDFRQAAKLLMDLAGALEYAHDLGVVHRDVKPANIMLDGKGNPLLMDFGLARLETSESKLTHDGTVLGTPSYMPPEQAAGKLDLVGPASDQYSLGVVLYELLCGSTPFSGPPTMVISLVINQEPPSPRQENPAAPKDLETICLKAMSKQREHRYANCAAMAEDLRRWLSGEPITARRVALFERFVRWCRRNPVVAGLSMAAALLLILVATISSAAYVRVVRAQRERTLAQVDSLRRAEVGQVPYLLEALRPVHSEIAPRLNELLQQPDLTENEHLRLSLALLADDPKQVEYLRDRLLEAEPAELPVIRTALLPHSKTLTEDLWKVVDDPQSSKDRRFRAACALAAFDPEGAGWAKAAPATAEVLVSENPLRVAAWVESLRPVAKRLLPRLQEAFQDATRPESERVMAAGILADYAAQQPDILAELIRLADAKQFSTLLPKLQSHAATATSSLEAELAKDIPHDAPEDDKEKLAKGKANAAAALLRMNRPEKVWSVLRHTPDPRARSYLVHRLAPLGIDPKVLIGRLDEEKEASVRRALLLALGEFDDKALSPAERQRLLPKLLTMFREDPDAGIHGATEWLLRQWGQQEKLLEISRRLAGPKVPERTDWYVMSRGHTMVIIRGPVEFRMGSPSAEANREEDETPHKRRIPRSFAVATKPVTTQQYLAFLAENPEIGRFSESMWHAFAPTRDCPMLAITWYEAAAYCNWLSKEDGIPDEQFCYQRNGAGEYPANLRAADDGLRRTGYRLPTEAEWEFLCRAGAVTSRYYGESAELLAKFAWYRENSNDRTWPVGSLKPNDLGAFDVLGNVYQWCHGGLSRYHSPWFGGAVDDTAAAADVLDHNVRMVRGGAFTVPSLGARSAHRRALAPESRQLDTGFRVARTIPEQASTPAQKSSSSLSNATDSWQTLTIPEVHYEVRFPAAPKKEVVPVDIGGGKTMTRTVYSVQTNHDKVIFYFAFTDAPSGLLKAVLSDTLLDGIRDEQSKKAGGRLVEEKKITVDGHVGRFCAFEGLLNGKKALFRVQSWIDGDRIFQATTNGEEGAFNPADADKFFASIRPL